MTRLSKFDAYLLFALRPPSHTHAARIWDHANDEICREITAELELICLRRADFFERMFGLEVLAQAVIVDPDLQESFSLVPVDPRPAHSWQQGLVNLGLASPTGMGWPQHVRRLVRSQLERSVMRQVGWPLRPSRVDLRDVPKVAGVIALAIDDHDDPERRVSAYLRAVTDDVVADRAHGLPERPVFRAVQSLRRLFCR